MSHVHSTAKLLQQIEALNAEKAAALTALAASVAYGQAQHARALRAEGEVRALHTMAQRVVYTPNNLVGEALEGER
jgi:hypothetical protein